MRVRDGGAGGAPAQSRSTSRPSAPSLHGHGADTDIIVASAKAYLGALNRMLVALGRRPAASQRPRSRDVAGREPQNEQATTLFDKIWDEHVVVEEPGAPAVLYVDLHLVHEVTSPQAFAGLRARGLGVRRPDSTVATMDHSTPTLPRGLARRSTTQARAQLAHARGRTAPSSASAATASASTEQGIVHVIGPELGLTQPGMTIVCGDSHTVDARRVRRARLRHRHERGRARARHAVPPAAQAEDARGARRRHAAAAASTAKDIILAAHRARSASAAAPAHVIEYTGTAIRALDMEARMTICNMSIEAGARAGLIAPDDDDLRVPRGPRVRAAGRRVGRGGRALAHARRPTTARRYDASVTLDATRARADDHLRHQPGHGHPVTRRCRLPDAQRRPTRERSRRRSRYMGLEAGKPLVGQPIDVVFVGSCTNARIADLRAAARVLRRAQGRRRRAHARRAGLAGGEAAGRGRGARRASSRDAGAEWREPGCSMCIAMNGDQLRARPVRGVSTSNRNFEGRQGQGGRTLPRLAADGGRRGGHRPRHRSRARSWRCSRRSSMHPFTTLRRRASSCRRRRRHRSDHPGALPQDDRQARASATQLFADWRARPRLPARRPRRAGAQILARGRQLRLRLVARARAVGARRLGLRGAIVAPSFADIFRGNALKNGLLPVAVDGGGHTPRSSSARRSRRAR